MQLNLPRINNVIFSNHTYTNLMTFSHKGERSSVYVKRAKTGFGLDRLEIHVRKISILSWYFNGRSLPSNHNTTFFSSRTTKRHRIAIYFTSRFILTGYLNIILESYTRFSLS